MRSRSTVASALPTLLLPWLFEAARTPSGGTFPGRCAGHKNRCVFRELCFCRGCDLWFPCSSSTSSRNTNFFPWKFLGLWRGSFIPRKRGMWIETMSTRKATSTPAALHPPETVGSGGIDSACSVGKAERETKPSLLLPVSYRGRLFPPKRAAQPNLLIFPLRCIAP